MLIEILCFHTLKQDCREEMLVSNAGADSQRSRGINLQVEMAWLSETNLIPESLSNAEEKKDITELQVKVEYQHIRNHILRMT